MIQLKDKGIQDKNAYIVVEKHLEDVATNKIQKIAKDLHITVKRVQNICDIIKMLEPKPARGFVVDSDNIRYIVPDVSIEKIGEEKYESLNIITVIISHEFCCCSSKKYICVWIRLQFVLTFF